MDVLLYIMYLLIKTFFYLFSSGLMPYNFICVRTGVMLSEISSLNEVFTVYTTLQLLVIAFVALVPGLVIKHLQNKRLSELQKDK